MGGAAAIVATMMGVARKRLPLNLRGIYNLTIFIA